MQVSTWAIAPTSHVGRLARLTTWNGVFKLWAHRRTETDAPVGREQVKPSVELDVRLPDHLLGAQELLPIDMIAAD